MCEFLLMRVRLVVISPVDDNPPPTSPVLAPDISNLQDFHGVMDYFVTAPKSLRSLQARRPSRSPSASRPPSTSASGCMRVIVAVVLIALTFTLAEVGMPLAAAHADTPPHTGPPSHTRLSSQAGPSSQPQPAWVSPVPALEIIEPFNPPSKAWLKGHRGIDVLTVNGEPLRAPTAGTIRFGGSVAGTATVSIETNSGYVVSFQPATSELKIGDQFSAGAEIGKVAEGGHCEDSCLHIGVWKAKGKKQYIDPAGFFGHEQSILLPLSRKPAQEHTGDSTTSGAGAWGEHRNGRIPAAAMCSLKSAPGQMLRCDAQSAFDRMSHAYAARFSTPISVTDAYRDYDTQVILKKRKGRMAATPGTSNHGWALAVDLGGGINSFGSAQHQWMRANAPKFGWILPGWARQTGSLPEPWHWEFRQ